MLIIHVVVGGGGIADDIYVGGFHDETIAVERARMIERAFSDLGLNVSCLVRELEPSRISMARLTEGWD